MAKKEKTTEAEKDEAETKGGGKLPIALALVGLALGGAGGMLVVGPAVAGGEESADAAEAPDKEAKGGHGSKSDDYGSESESDLHVIEGVVVNPRSSNGSRFLLIDLAVQAADDEMLAELERREPEIRDRLLLSLGNYTVDELADIEMRERIKESLRQVVEELLGRDVHTIYLPRYVIQ